MRLNILFIWFTVVVVISPAATPASEIKIIDTIGEQTFSKPPQRSVVLNWDLLEQVLELNVIPVGAPNIAGYRQWVVQPKIPGKVADIGTRAEPNLEKIARLAPDVILAASPQKDLISSLTRIAPVVFLANYGLEDPSAERAIQHFKTLSTLFGREEIAGRKLKKMENRFKTLRTEIAEAFGQPPGVVAMRFSNITSVWVYGENSTAHYVLQKLGLGIAMPQPAAPWGIVQKRLKEMQYVNNGYVLYIMPFPDEKRILQSVLWRAMPFVRGKRVNSVSPVWNYGGAISLMYMAEAFTKSLLELAPER